MEKWAIWDGGVWATYGFNLASVHYLGKFLINEIIIVHKSYMLDAEFSLFAFKALSNIMCYATLAQTAYMILFVKKTLALSTFGKGIWGKVLAWVVVGEALAKDKPKNISNDILFV